MLPPRKFHYLRDSSPTITSINSSGRLPSKKYLNHTFSSIYFSVLGHIRRSILQLKGTRPHYHKLHVQPFPIMGKCRFQLWRYGAMPVSRPGRRTSLIILAPTPSKFISLVPLPTLVPAKAVVCQNLLTFPSFIVSRRHKHHSLLCDWTFTQLVSASFDVKTTFWKQKSMTTYSSSSASKQASSLSFIVFVVVVILQEIHCWLAGGSCGSVIVLPPTITTAIGCNDMWKEDVANEAATHVSSSSSSLRWSDML